MKKEINGCLILLQWLASFHRNDLKDKKTVLAVCDLDAYSRGLNFVFGQAHINDKIAAIYLPRLRQESYGMNQDKELFYERAIKEAVHELGHVLALLYCRRPSIDQPLFDCVRCGNRRTSS